MGNEPSAGPCRLAEVDDLWDKDRRADIVVPARTPKRFSRGKTALLRW